MSSDESSVDDGKIEQRKDNSCKALAAYGQTRDYHYFIRMYNLSEANKEFWRREECIEMQNSILLSFLQKVRDKNEALKDREHFVCLAMDMAKLELPYDPETDNLYEQQEKFYEFASAPECAAAFQKKYDRYKELLTEGENKINEIMSVSLLSEYPPNINSIFRMKYDRYKKLLEEGKIKDDDRHEFKKNWPVRDRIELPFPKIGTLIEERLCLFYFQAMLRKHFSIEEALFIKKGINNCPGEYFLVDENPFSTTPSRVLAWDLLQKEEIALKVARGVYPLKDVYKVGEGAYVEDLPYILHKISSKYKDQLKYLYCLEERLEQTGEIIENAIKDESLMVYRAAGEEKDRVKYKELATWLKEKYEQNPKFPVSFPDWLKAKIEMKNNSNEADYATLKQFVNSSKEVKLLYYLYARIKKELIDPVGKFKFTSFKNSLQRLLKPEKEKFYYEIPNINGQSEKVEINGSLLEKLVYFLKNSFSIFK